MDFAHMKKFRTIWEKGNYRQGSTAQRLVPLILEIVPENATINDYGCGTGRAEVEINKVRPNQIINLVDIADNAFEKEAKNLFGAYLWIGDLSCLPECFPHADWGLCINTLMTVQPEQLETILSEIRRTCDNLIFEAYDMEDHRCGFQLTTVKKNGEEWKEILSQYWPQIEERKSSESKRRYIFICRS